MLPFFAVRQLHREFLRAGANVLQTFTFYASDDKLESWGNYVADKISVSNFILFITIFFLQVELLLPESKSRHSRDYAMPTSLGVTLLDLHALGWLKVLYGFNTKTGFIFVRPNSFIQ